MNRQKPYCSKEELISFLKEEKVYDEIVEKALSQAAFSHRYHCRDDGQSYLTQHIFPLTRDAYNYFRDTPDAHLAVIVTLLHDVPEKDIYYTEKRLEADFGAEIATHVRYLLKPVKTTAIRTQQDRHDEQVEFMKMIVQSPILCKVIKTMDRLNNLVCTDVSRDIAKYERFLKDTVELYLPLAAEVDSKLESQMKNEIARIDVELKMNDN